MIDMTGEKEYEDFAERDAFEKRREWIRTAIMRYANARLSAVGSYPKCPTCGRPFLKTDSDKTFHSKKCREKYHSNVNDKVFERKTMEAGNERP